MSEKIKEIESSDTNEIAEVDSSSFIKYYQDQLINFDHSLSENTIKSYRSAFLMLNNYLKHVKVKDLQFENIDKKLAFKFKNYLIDQNLASSTIAKYFKHFKTIYNRGLDDGHKSNIRSPFKSIKIVVPVKTKQFLTIDHIKNLINADIPRESQDELTKMTFLVQYFAQGLRISDLFTIRYKDIVVDSTEASIEFSQFKTKHQLTVFVGMNLLKYLCFFISPKKFYEFYFEKKYNFLLNNKEYTMTFFGHQERHKFLFNKKDVGSKFYNKSVDFMCSLNKTIFLEQLQLLKQKKKEDPYEFLVYGLDKSLYNEESFAPRKNLNEEQKAKFSTCRNNYVKNLKLLDKYMGSSINIVGHTARHSYARHQLSIGTDSYLIRDLLGHKNISTTEKYLQGFPTKLIKGNVKKSHDYVTLNFLNDFTID
ncbi:tyrosine-type recombinase/integrase [Marixanthomonas ophiurae]|uniref:tyrosine-type recombinase/integrase n=1 Tax=Marixanthomonas ophiurae TaxID=387659 RepID=UPI0013142549|nr:site-specific integrase [Marixanthomonas ophiurae]